ncbi:MAG: tRNA (adenosine(37)-N6)-threonylcarbamoyltransferase complex dimerization subunit type 1 TsaB [Deltaproteobacteria bacterium]|nr:tRNA (adenosine(37)-N6)-threonylcarbamoyltransferase complex dimerization subunit type 1 TsaB [Deltaproteobacteria bacterium]MBW2007317.1 tRNA (adenosine(37)-N6)-threonylcarbamoyltransferase complex dimerization subunit type 1 TsaB [Deltaproteobacteria bacterium]
MKRSLILALNTTTMQYGLALLREAGSVVAEEIREGRDRRFGGLLPVLGRMLEESRASLQSLKAVAVATGPGSFTGLRVGLSAAKGLCHGLGIPLIGISSLEALAHQVPFSPGPVCALVDSRRGEFFVARFRHTENGRLQRTTDDECLGADDLRDRAWEPAVWIGNDYSKQAPILEQALDGTALLAPPQMWHIRASSVGALAMERLRKGDTDDLGTLKPLYHRPPDIRPNPYPLRGGFEKRQGR